MMKKFCNSRRKNELITSRRIPKDIYEGEDEVRGKINKESLKKALQKSSTRLYDEVIVRQWMENECHHHVKES